MAAPQTSSFPETTFYCPNFHVCLEALSSLQKLLLPKRNYLGLFFLNSLYKVNSSFSLSCTFSEGVRSQLALRTFCLDSSLARSLDLLSIFSVILVFLGTNFLPLHTRIPFSPVSNNFFPLASLSSTVSLKPFQLLPPAQSQNQGICFRLLLCQPPIFRYEILFQ